MPCAFGDRVGVWGHVKPKLEHDHHGLQAELHAYSRPSLWSELFAAPIAWIPVVLVAEVFASIVATWVECSGFWLVNERVMITRVVLISIPTWLALYALLVTTHRKAKWRVGIDQRTLTLQWRRLGLGATWKIPISSITAVTISDVHPRHMTLHFEDERVLRLDAGAHARSQLQPIAHAIESASRAVRDEPVEPLPDPPRALLHMISRPRQAE